MTRGSCRSARRRGALRARGRCAPARAVRGCGTLAEFGLLMGRVPRVGGRGRPTLGCAAQRFQRRRCAVGASGFAMSFRCGAARRFQRRRCAIEASRFAMLFWWRAVRRSEGPPVATHSPHPQSLGGLILDHCRLNLQFAFSMADFQFPFDVATRRRPPSIPPWTGGGEEAMSRARG